MTWLLPESALTPEQCRLVRGPVTDHRLIVGPPGSGKTLILLHRARFLLDTYGDDFPGLRILTSTPQMEAFLRPSLDLLGLPRECLGTFEGWCKAYFRAHVSGTLPHREGRLDLEIVLGAVARFVNENPALWFQEGFVMLDEGQELPVQAYEILEKVARHVTVGCDPSPQGTDGGAQPSEILAALGSPGGLRRLDRGWHHPDVARLAATFLPDPGARERLLQPSPTEATEREVPLVHFAKDGKSGQARLIELVRQRMLMNQRIGILVGQDREVARVIRLLEAAGIPSEAALPAKIPSDVRGADYSNAFPKVGTFHGARGLRFDGVFLPDLSDGSFPEVSGAARWRRLFGALIRASRWVFIGREAGRPFAEDPWLQEAARAGYVVLQHETDSPKGGRRVEAEPEPLSVL